MMLIILRVKWSSYFEQTKVSYFFHYAIDCIYFFYKFLFNITV